MTRPDNNMIATIHVSTLVNSINQDFEDTGFIVSLITKWSRKFMEPNIYTKLKSLLGLHLVYQKLEDDPQNVIMTCIQSLRKEKDLKYEKSYFYNDIDSSLATNVGEIESYAFLQEYYSYFFFVVDLRGDRSKYTTINIEKKLQQHIKLVQLNEKLKSICLQASTGENNPILKQCVDVLLNDHNWAIKQLSKIYEVSFYFSFRSIVLYTIVLFIQIHSFISCYFRI